MKMKNLAMLANIIIMILFLGCRSRAPRVGALRQGDRTAGGGVSLVTLGEGFSPKEVEQTIGQAGTFISGLTYASARPLPASAYYAPRRRYRADSIIQWLSRDTEPGGTTIGITKVDISSTKDSIADWGVMGLGFQPGRACVASDFRLKRKDQLWKLVVHEWGHTQGLAHCTVDSCFMRDAEGQDHTTEERNFCPSCQKKLAALGTPK